MSRLRRTLVLAILVLGAVPPLVVSAGSAQAAAPVDVFVADVTDSPDPVALGATVFYSVGVGNNGPGTATSVVLTVEMSPGATFEPSGSTGSCSTVGSTVTCPVGTLQPGFGAALTLAVAPTTTGTLSLSFTAFAVQSDRDPSNNIQTESTTVTAEADVSLQLGEVLGVVYAGQPFFVAVQMSNAGPSPATGVTTILRLPAGLAVVSGASCLPDGGGSVCTVGPTTLPPSTGSVALLQIAADAAGEYAISGSVVADQPDPLPANNVDSVTFTVTAAADLAVAVAESADPSRSNKPLTYTMTVTNHGPSPATAVSLADEWSAALSGSVRLLSVGTSQGACTVTAPSRFDCDLGVLPADAAATVTLGLRPRGAGTITDRADVTAAEHDPDPANNVASESTVID
ncbi:MAG: hypothetical protein ACRDP9_07950 [Kribbellaceae bacterium]